MTTAADPEDADVHGQDTDDGGAARRLDDPTVADGTDATGVDSASDVSTSTFDDQYTRKRTVLITGCSSGIGNATAKAFLEDEWRVIATARNETEIDDLADAGCDTLSLDVTEPGQVAAAVEETVDRAGTIDCLVNNAGYAQMGPLEDVPTHDLHRQFDVNVYGPHRLTRAALPHMRAQESGRIVNVSSLNGLLSIPGTGAYAASKHALEAMSDALRAEVEPFGVDVVVVEPGPVETSFTDRVASELPAERRTPAYEELYDVIDDVATIGGDGPLAIDPADVARAILQVSTCAEPPARYPVGPVAEYGQYARFLPDGLRDTIYRLLRRVV